jgi:hypothetical protein
MSYGRRHFLFEPDGTMRHLPQRVVNGLIFDLDFLPQYAGFELRHACVILELEGGKPISVIKVEADIWRFDYRGSMRDFMLEGIAKAQSSFIRTDGWEGRGREPSPDAIEARKAYQAKYRWEPGSPEINRMIHAIWPKDAGRPVLPPAIAPGIATKRVPVTHEAKHAFRQIHEGSWRLIHSISDMSDQSLKAFRQLVSDEQLALAERPGQHLMVGVYAGYASAIDGEFASRARWKNTKGPWYAVVTIYREVSKDTSETAAEYHQKCTGKKAAISAARELLLEHAAKFDDGVTVEAEIFPEGEWAPAG